MAEKRLFALWGGMFIVCAGLGFIPEPEGALRGILTFAALIFFLPGGALLFLALRRRDKDCLRLIRNLSALSLGLTLGVLVLSFLTALGPEKLGTVLHHILTVVSTPMICGGSWAMSLFLWACLLMGSMTGIKKM